MPELQFRVESVKAMEHSATPVLAFALRISNAVPEELIQSIGLSCQIHIQPGRRRYAPEEQPALADLFGEPERWGTTLRPLFWTHVSTAVPAFRDETVAELLVPCTFDFNVAATKYFYALENGEIPVLLLFSGTIMYRAGEALQMAPVPHSKEAACRIPASTWKEMMAAHYSDSAWLNLQRETFDRIYHYKIRHGLPTWEQMLEHVLAAAGESKP